MNIMSCVKVSGENESFVKCFVLYFFVFGFDIQVSVLIGFLKTSRKLYTEIIDLDLMQA